MPTGQSLHCTGECIEFQGAKILRIIQVSWGKNCNQTHMARSVKLYMPRGPHQRRAEGHFLFLGAEIALDVFR